MWSETEKEENVCKLKFNSHRTGLGHKHGRRLIVLGQQGGYRVLVCRHSTKASFFPICRKITSFIAFLLVLYYLFTSSMIQQGVFQYFEGQLKRNEL